MQEYYLEDCRGNVRIKGVLRCFDVFGRKIKERESAQFFFFLGQMRGLKALIVKK